MKSCSLISSSSRLRTSERGIVFVLVSIAGFAIAAVIALAFATGSLVLTKSKQQNIANLAALAALKAFVEAEPESPQTPLTLEEKMQLALEAAEEIVVSNGFSTASGSLALAHLNQDTSGSLLEFGTYYPRGSVAQNMPSPCNNSESPPCFVSYVPDGDGQTSADTLNSLRIALRTPAAGVMIRSLAQFAGTADSIEIESYATASMVQRCIAFVMDASLSATGDTHKQLLRPVPRQEPDPDNPGGYRLVSSPPFLDASSSLPANQAYFAYRAENIERPGGCGNRNNFLGQVPFEFLSWCLLEDARPPGVSSPPSKRYKSDYTKQRSPAGDIYIDTFADAPPQPMTSFYQSFNSALRLLRYNGNPLDRASFLVFGSGERDFIPLTDEIGPMIQITNIENRGLTSECTGIQCDPTQGVTDTTQVTTEKFPNFVSRNHVSLVDDPTAGTNLLFAFVKARHELQQCPATAKKMIIIATDGKGTCAWDGRQASGYTCVYGTPVWYAQREQLVGRPVAGGQWVAAGDWYNAVGTTWPFWGPTDAINIRDQFVADQITVTSMIAGDHIGLNFRNVPKPSGGFLNFEEAAAEGWWGYRSQAWNDTCWHTELWRSGDRCQIFFLPHQQGIYWPGAQFEWSFGPDAGPWRQFCIAKHREHMSVYGGSNNDNDYWYWCSWEAYNTTYAGLVPNVRDLVPQTIMGELSMRTGGKFCPLMPLCNERFANISSDPDYWYECPVGDPKQSAAECPVTRTLIDARRGGGFPESDGTPNDSTWQVCAVSELTPAQQAEKCALDTIGQNPYMLVETFAF